MLEWLEDLFFSVDANNHIGVKLYYYHKIEAISCVFSEMLLCHEVVILA